MPSLGSSSVQIRLTAACLLDWILLRLLLVLIPLTRTCIMENTRDGTGFPLPSAQIINEIDGAATGAEIAITPQVIAVKPTRLGE